MFETNVLVEVLARSGLAVVLAGAAVAKLLAPRQALAAEIEAFGLLPRRATVPVAVTLPCFELALAVALLLGLSSSSAASSLRSAACRD